MKIYLPLSREGDLFIAEQSPVENSAWREQEFLDFFESNLESNFTKDEGRVSIFGSEYADCPIFIPNSEENERPYIAVNEDLVPVNAIPEEDSTESSAPDQNCINRWLIELKDSEEYFYDLSVDLSTRYILPNISIENSESFQLFDFNDIKVSSRVLLVGPPGAGKTSFARHLAHSYAKRLRNKRTPPSPTAFYVQLRDFSNKTSRIIDSISFNEERIGHNHVTFQRQRGRIIYIFDGLDELNVEDRFEFSSWLNSFHLSQPSVCTIVTSRELPSLNEGFWKTFKKAKIEPFNRSQVFEYCKLLIPDKSIADDFLGIIDDNPNLGSFLTNPFSLSLALGIYLVRGVLPYNIGALCKEVVLHFSEKWDAKRGIKRSSYLTPESTTATLGRLAYKLQRARHAQFSSEMLEGILPADVEDLSFEQVLNDITATTGLLQEISPRIWSFSHRYFQDFFCANFLMERAGGLSRELREHGNDADWMNVWRQVGQLCSDPEFFAENDSRSNANPVQSIDRIVASLLAHDGLSRSEISQLANGLSEEIQIHGSRLPNVSYSTNHSILNTSDLSENECFQLASLLVALHYLRGSLAAKEILDKLPESKEEGIVDLFRKILLSKIKPKPKIGSKSLEIYFD